VSVDHAATEKRTKPLVVHTHRQVRSHENRAGSSFDLNVGHAATEKRSKPLVVYTHRQVRSRENALAARST
jgi:hypothetical protein